MRIKAKPVNFSLINEYAPIESTAELLPKEDTILILDDFNANVGKETSSSNLENN